MARRSIWELTPQQSIEAECARRGRPRVVAGCLALLAGERCDDALVRALAGPAADPYLDGTATGEHWFRVWGARGLLWAWLDSPAARSALVQALSDEAWRVREMAAKVVARHLVGDALDAVAALRDDRVPRVRAAAERAVARLAAAEA